MSPLYSTTALACFIFALFYLFYFYFTGTSRVVLCMIVRFFFFFFFGRRYGAIYANKGSFLEMIWPFETRGVTRNGTRVGDSEEIIQMPRTFFFAYSWVAKRCFFILACMVCLRAVDHLSSQNLSLCVRLDLRSERNVFFWPRGLQIITQHSGRVSLGGSRVIMGQNSKEVRPITPNSDEFCRNFKFWF